jgi:hypothetical protein
MLVLDNASKETHDAVAARANAEIAASELEAQVSAQSQAFSELQLEFGAFKQEMFEKQDSWVA